jgi:hypothetical protein
LSVAHDPRVRIQRAGALTPDSKTLKGHCMSSISILFVAAISCAVIGCKKSGADCAKAIDHSMDLSKAEMTARPGMDDKILQKMKDLGLQHCKDDKWSEDVLTCMTEAKTMSDSQACYAKLSPEQQGKMNTAATELAPAPTGATGAGSVTGSATGGDATGSSNAGSGSAAAPM